MLVSKDFVYLIFLYGLCNAAEDQLFVDFPALKGYKCKEEKSVFNYSTDTSALACASNCMAFPTCMSKVYLPESRRCTGCASFTGEIDVVHNTSRFYRRGYGYIGCFDHNPRFQTGILENIPSMTTELCMDMCLANDFAYTMTEYGTACFCGNNHNYAELNAQLHDVSCNYNCAGNSSQKCGGSYKGSMYRTGVHV